MLPQQTVIVDEKARRHRATGASLLYCVLHDSEADWDAASIVRETGRRRKVSDEGWLFCVYTRRE